MKVSLACTDGPTASAVVVEAEFFTVELEGQWFQVVTRDGSLEISTRRGISVRPSASNAVRLKADRSFCDIS